jgi:hypothetical protein
MSLKENSMLGFMFIFDELRFFKREFIDGHYYHLCCLSKFTESESGFGPSSSFLMMKQGKVNS